MKTIYGFVKERNGAVPSKVDWMFY